VWAHQSKICFAASLLARLLYQRIAFAMLLLGSNGKSSMSTQPGCAGENFRENTA